MSEEPKIDEAAARSKRPWIWVAVAVLGVALITYFAVGRNGGRDAVVAETPSTSPSQSASPSTQPSTSQSAVPSSTPGNTSEADPAASTGSNPSTSEKTSGTPATGEPATAQTGGSQSTGASTGTQDTGALALVDPAQFAGKGGVGEGWYFQTPSGNFTCGVAGSSYGCQARKVSVKGLEQCGTNYEHKTAMVMVRDGKVTPDCTTQGIFGFSDGEPSKALEYGQTMQVEANGKQITCTSDADGLTCREPGAGFKISTEGVTVLS